MKLSDDLWKQTFGINRHGDFVVKATVNQDSLDFIAHKIANMESDVLNEALKKARIETSSGYYEFLDKFSRWDEEKQNTAMDLCYQLEQEMFRIKREQRDND